MPDFEQVGYSNGEIVKVNGYYIIWYRLKYVGADPWLQYFGVLKLANRMTRIV